MSYGIPPASSMFVIANELAITSSRKKIPGIMKIIRQAACRQKTNVMILKLSRLEIDNLIWIFGNQGYSADHGPDGRGPSLIINWEQK